MSGASVPTCARHVYDNDKPLNFIFPDNKSREQLLLLQSKPDLIAMSRLPGASHETVLTSGVTAGQYCLWMIRRGPMNTAPKRPSDQLTEKSEDML